MKNTIFLKLRELVETAAMLERSLLLEDRINLISYDPKGKIKSSRLYDYDPDSIKNLEEHLDKIALKQRQKWEPEFMRLVPPLATLGWETESNNLGVTVHKDKTTSIMYPYNDIGFYEMADQLTDALLEKHAAKFADCHSAKGTTQTEQGTNKSCQNCHNDRCDKNPNLMLLLWDTLTEEQQEQFLAKLSPEAREKLEAALQIGG